MKSTKKPIANPLKYSESRLMLSADYFNIISMVPFTIYY